MFVLFKHNPQRDINTKRFDPSNKLKQRNAHSPSWNWGRRHKMWTCSSRMNSYERASCCISIACHLVVLWPWLKDSDCDIDAILRHDMYKEGGPKTGPVLWKFITPVYDDIERQPTFIYTKCSVLYLLWGWCLKFITVKYSLHLTSKPYCSQNSDSQFTYIPVL